MILWLGRLWCGINTIAGLLLALIGWCSWRRRIEPYGLLFVARPGGLARWWLKRGGPGGLVERGFGAFTCGEVVILRDPTQDQEQMLCHELRHTWQGFVWGPLWVPAYCVGMLVAWARGLNPYRACFLELDARRAAGED